jgi:hypothetical protein
LRRHDWPNNFRPGLQQLLKLLMLLPLRLLDLMENSM